MDLVITTKLALVDAINPCVLAIQASLLAVLLTKSRRDALIGGILFTITIFIMYLLYGLILHSILSMFYDYVRIFLLVLLLVLAILEIAAYFNYKPGLISIEMPIKLRPLANQLIENTKNPLIAIPLAILLSLFLLPCSSGPYVSFLGLQKTIDWVLLLYYLTIFVSPMILITLLVYYGFSPEKIKEWRDKHIRELHLVAGILLLLVLLYLI
ncbi:NEQ030 [Nanoarchaeum equitans Kin4-M]|uniref:NEQ030 n=1 Tax=Nanoarchaeum equitans (strain Kin4-M) TaxID=228908 RepID=Q74MG5_NANEQ|nr:NEQ030 [Nanoarchaeum equitans Kin4-M]